LRVLVAHNLYRSMLPSGENAAVQADIALLRRAGVDVIEWLPTSDSIGELSFLQRAELALSPVVYAPGRRAMQMKIREHRPHLVHVHNVLPLISASAISMAQRLRVPVVQTMHNYRIGCMAGTHVRGENGCQLCIRFHNPIPGMLHGCYRSSRWQSASVAAGQLLHRQLWRSLDHYIVLTPFMREYLTRCGVAEEAISLRPTWTEDPGEPPNPGGDILFAGRLEASKGILQLLEVAHAVRSTGRRIRVAGSGPLDYAVVDHPDIDYLGQIGREALSAEYLRAGVVVLPSRCLEGLPLTLVEAFAHGRAVVVPRGGSPATVVDDRIGWIYDGTARGLREVLTGMNHDALRRRGAAARERYIQRFSATVAEKRLLTIYRRAVAKVALTSA
jgi:glycosyltransferase involved in cell wall biosynthesis